jgi:uncharacterized protein DUF4115
VPADLSAQSAARQQPAGVRQQPIAAKQPAESTHKISWLVIAAIPAAMALAAGGWFAWQKFEARRAEWNAAAVALPAPPAPPGAPSGFWSALEDSTVSASEAPASSPWSAAAANWLLKIYADKDTSLTVSSDGSPVFAGSMSAGESRSVTAASTLTVDAQDAGAIRLELNGQPVQAIGRPGQPARITLGNPSAPADAGGHN